jgi:hypothetical protein
MKTIPKANAPKQAMKKRVQLYNVDILGKLKRYRVAILFFLSSWAVYGATTNLSDINFYGLYHVGAESLIDFHTYTIGYSLVPGWKDAGDGDVFTYHDRRFPAKQPGAFFATAVPYFFLDHFFGITYLNHRELVASLTSWFSAGLIGAIGVGAFYELLILLGFTAFTSFIGTFSFAFCTTFFPYTGVPHHDIMSTVCLIAAFFSLTRFKLTKNPTDYRGAGSFLGLTLFFSMLPALLVACILVYAVTLSFRKKDWFQLFLGFCIGYLPLGLFNAYYFKNPFLQANVAGNFKDTFFQLSTKLMAEHFHDYFGRTSYLSVTQMMPVFLLGIMGIFSLRKRLKKEAILLGGLLVIHCAYIFNITTIGHCQFGPRYLIPLIPFMMIGLCGLISIRKKWVMRASSVIVTLTIIYSFAVNTLGAIGDTMFCGNLVNSPITQYWQSLHRLLNDQFLVRPYSFFVFGLAMIFYFFTRTRNIQPVDGLFTKLS